MRRLLYSVITITCANLLFCFYLVLFFMVKTLLFDGEQCAVLLIFGQNLPSLIKRLSCNGRSYWLTNVIYPAVRTASIGPRLHRGLLMSGHGLSGGRYAQEVTRAYLPQRSLYHLQTHRLTFAADLVAGVVQRPDHHHL